MPTGPTPPKPVVDPAQDVRRGLAPNGVHAAGEVPVGMGPVVVTGVCGFIGSHLALTLWQQGATVIGVDTRPLVAAERTAGHLRRLCDQPRFRLLTASVDDREVTRQLSTASTVIHLVLTVVSDDDVGVAVRH